MKIVNDLPIRLPALMPVKHIEIGTIFSGTVEHITSTFLRGHFGIVDIACPRIWWNTVDCETLLVNDFHQYKAELHLVDEIC